MAKTGVPKLILSDDSPEVSEKPRAKSSKSGSGTRITAVAKPTTLKLITDAITQQNERKGSTVAGIKKYIEVTHGFVPTNVVLKKALAKGLDDGVLLRKDGKDPTASLNGRYSAPKKVSKRKVTKENDGPKETEEAPSKEKLGRKTKPSDKEEKQVKSTSKDAGRAPPKKAAKEAASQKAVAVAAPANKKRAAKPKTTKKGSVSDTELVQAEKEKPKMAVKAAAHRRRSKSESEASKKGPAKGEGPATKSRGKAAPAGKRALRV